MPIENAINKLSQEPNAFAQEILDKRKKAIKLIDEMLAQPLESRDSEEANYKTVCEKAVNNLFNKNAKGKELIELLCPGTVNLSPVTSNSEKFAKTYFDSANPLTYLVGYLFASGCALSAENEYDSELDRKE